MKRPDTPFPRHWLYYIALKIALIALAVLILTPLVLNEVEARAIELEQQAFVGEAGLHNSAGAGIAGSSIGSLGRGLLSGR